MYTLVETAKRNGLAPEALSAQCPRRDRWTPDQPNRRITALEYRRGHSRVAAWSAAVNHQLPFNDCGKATIDARYDIRPPLAAGADRLGIEINSDLSLCGQPHSVRSPSRVFSC